MKRELQTERLKTPPTRFNSLAPEVWESLGKLERTGWLNRGIQQAETVKEHTLSVRELAFALFHDSDDLSIHELQDLLDILEVHDWPEAIVGDLVILDEDEASAQRLKAEKHAQEATAMKDICSQLLNNGTEILALWERYEAGQDKIAQLAKEIDKFQAVLKAWEYEKQYGLNGLTEEFVIYSKRYVSHPLLKQKLSEIEEAITEIGVTQSDK